MKTVLIVDDDPVTRALLSRVLKPHASYFNVLTAKNGIDALDMIKDKKINLVITDVQMPEMDGFELVSRLSQERPEIPIFMMTAFGDSDMRARVDSIGLPQYFEKPLNIDVITECILDELSTGAEGQIQGISLASFLQLVEMESKTCTLKITSSIKKGIMYFFKGDFMQARTKDLSGEAAANEMLCWDRIVIEIDNVCKTKEKKIVQPLMNILMEGMRLKDEKDSAKKKKQAPLKPLHNFSKK